MIPKVSVFMVTYNHEQFISKAIESVLNQITNFNIELVIAEDCSTDKTREIVLHFKEKYPHIIKLELNRVNIGAQKKFCKK
ncbi:hypothetical protein HMSSN036_23750 [Paenibacillus macerans]|nr:hypothetical protein HMSSN036_23750 [Paenibacillus macerans]